MEVKSSYKVFVTMLRRYGLMPYRYHGQRYTTVMIQVPERFVTETLWPEFQKINAELTADTQLGKSTGSAQSR